ncbi:pyridine nucleotide-disulfide oxidoreductase [Paenibacillus sp. PCH8]|uniref:FAD-dependent oxidoreductase n=1 Tax=Paenibacillus sp. PCH8 TaxID=2066524 RepID=UPI000CF87D32|nr:FAD-dependent oxidoreductase [Paenibacillus sp. PCH8]PQP80777.1 pyridine nucleotide-disulfide oxidoreductase [Paenibacillus sp. PCH8]
MKVELVQSDITVIGGGLAGVCAAIAAARLGSRIALVQNRPVLGGNSSSEVRVWVCGATAHGINRYARETGIMGELFVENQYRNPEGNPYLWDLVILEAVRAELNISLYLNTDVHEVEATGDGTERTITSVTGWMMGSERKIKFESSMYLDCTGDGLVGFLAGAKFALGREARSEYGEEWAPEVADQITLGSTLLFYTKDAGAPVRYIPPSFAKDITQTSIPIRRVIRSGDSGCHYWWIEWGGEHDTVHDNELIRDELWSVIYGIWDYIKNSGKFEADQMTLEWIGSLPGKREYRRFTGDYVLTQNDIISQREFPDAVAFGGWSIDLHPPQGMYAEASGSKHMHADGVYHVPFRSLYSANVRNMLMAGRDISASHVAFGTTRVMATCAVIGEAAGTGAALCAAMGVTPRELYAGHLATLQQTLLRQDASIIGVRSNDELDLARHAEATASSTLTGIALEQPGETYPLGTDAALLLPVHPRLSGLELLLDASSDTELAVELWDTGRKENYVPHTLQATTTANLTTGIAQWVKLPLEWCPDEPQNAFIIIRANTAVSLYHSTEAHSGILIFFRTEENHVSKNLEDHATDQPVVLWSMQGLARKPFCCRTLSMTAAYSAAQTINGYHRPFGGPQQWMSQPMQSAQPEWVQLTWDAPLTLAELHLTFNDDVNEDLVNLHHHKTPFRVMPEVVRDYRVEWLNPSGEWTGIVSVTENHKRKVIHSLDLPVHAQVLRILIDATHGSRYAELIEIRAYAEPTMTGRS